MCISTYLGADGWIDIEPYDMNAHLMMSGARTQIQD